MSLEFVLIKNQRIIGAGETIAAAQRFANEHFEIQDFEDNDVYLATTQLVERVLDAANSDLELISSISFYIDEYRIADLKS